jgi:hypothetical protein
MLHRAFGILAAYGFKLKINNRNDYFERLKIFPGLFREA